MSSNKLRIRERKYQDALKKQKKENFRNNISKNIDEGNEMNRRTQMNGRNHKRVNNKVNRNHQTRGQNNKVERKRQLRNNAINYQNNKGFNTNIIEKREKIKRNRKQIIENGNVYQLDSSGKIIENKRRKNINIHNKINDLSIWSQLLNERNNRKVDNNDGYQNENNGDQNESEEYDDYSNNNDGYQNASEEYDSDSDDSRGSEKYERNNNSKFIQEYKNNTDSSKFSTDSKYSSKSYKNKSCCDINWKLQLYNDLFVYGINPAVNTVNDNAYLLGQFQAPGISLDDFFLSSSENTSSAFYLETNSSGEILSAIKLWEYNGIREDYQFGQMLFTSDSTNIVLLTTFVGEITFNNGDTISDVNGNTMLGLFELDGSPVWVRQITARSIDDIYCTLDSNDNIYICGTFSGTLSVSDPSSPLITSNLETNMFIGRINADGTTIWLKTALGTGYNTGEGIDFSENDNTIVTCGNYTETFILDNFTLADTVANINSWISKLNLDGDVINVISPLRPPTEDPILIDFFDTSQIISTSNGDIYVTGDMLGFFVFTENIQIVAENFSVFAAKLNEDLQWQWVSILQVDIPLANFYQPKITVVESQSVAVVTNFGFGKAIFFRPNTSTIDNSNDSSIETSSESDNNTVLYECSGSGTLDLWISQLNVSDGTWNCSNSLCGTIENFSIDIVSTSDDVYIAASHLVNNERTDGVLLNIAI